ncbi:MAG: hypothetical protein AB7I33_06910 [Gemmatimonadales bacterium]
MTIRREQYPFVVAGVLTAIQAGTAVWRMTVMFREGLAVGFRPLVLSAGLAEELLLALAIGLAAWWWLPADERTGHGWALRFLGLVWGLALGTYVVGLVWHFDHRVTWALLLALSIAGAWARRSHGSTGIAPPALAGSRPVLWAAAAVWLLQLPHLFFPYHWTDTKDIWACRAVAFEQLGFRGIFECLDPPRPPLQSVLLWLGHTNQTIEGRLLPFLMVGAAGLVVYRLLRELSPRLAPWGLFWFFATVRIYQGSVSNYADVPTMIAILVGIAVAADRRGVLLRSPTQAVLLAFVAGAVAALIKRDGVVMIGIGTAVVLFFQRGQWRLRSFAGVAGAAVGILAWTLRPGWLQAPPVYTIEPPGPGVLRVLITMLYGMQGQALSHYGYGMSIWLWAILAVWLYLRKDAPAPSPTARQWTWVALVGWAGLIGIYAGQVLTGHEGRGSLYVIRTAFGRHMVHMFPFALLSAIGFAEALRMRPEGGGAPEGES